MIEFRMTTDLDAALPAEIGFNFDEQKSWLQERLQHYNSLVVTEDTIKEGKEDRAKLNKLKTAIEDRRKEIKKQWNQPYAEFESKVKELTALIDQPIAAIDGQLKSYEEQRKEAKRREIQDVYYDTVPESIREIIPLDRIFDQKWLNATMSIAKVEEAIFSHVKRVNADLLALDAVEAEYKPAVRAKYIETLDLGEALNHRNTLQKAAAAFRASEAAKAMQEPPAAPEPVREPVRAPEVAPAQTSEKLYALRLEMHLTMAQANALKKFLADAGIKYEKISKED